MNTKQPLPPLIALRLEEDAKIAALAKRGAERLYKDLLEAPSLEDALRISYALINILGESAPPEVVSTIIRGINESQIIKRPDRPLETLADSSKIISSLEFLGLPRLVDAFSQLMVEAKDKGEIDFFAFRMIPSVIKRSEIKEHLAQNQTLAGCLNPDQIRFLHLLAQESYFWEKPNVGSQLKARDLPDTRQGLIDFLHSLE